MVKLGQQLTVLAPKTGDWCIVDRSLPFTVIRMPSSTSKFLRLFLTSWYTLVVALTNKPRAIYSSHWFTCGISAALCSLILGIPCFQAIHGSEIIGLEKSPLLYQLFRWVCGKSRGFVVSSRYQERILENLGVDRKKVFISYQGVDTEKFRKNATKERIIMVRHRLEGKRVLLTVARLVERKGHDMVIKALPKVLALLPNTVYLVVGTGPMQEKLIKLARERGVSDKVIFSGFVPDDEIPAYYYVCDIFVMPNREVDGDVEGFGITFVEAGICGKAVVGGRSAGVVEVIEEGVTGYLVNPNDVDELACVLTKALQDVETTAILGSNGRVRVLQKYDFQKITTRILTYLKRNVA